MIAVGQGGDTITLVADRLGRRISDVIGEIQVYLVAEIGDLRGDPQLLDLLRASVAGNVETMLDALRYDIAIERVEPPTAALEYARRLAQRGIPSSALARAYRLGQEEMLAHVLDEIRRLDLDPAEALGTFEAIGTVAFRYIDWISEQVIDAYETERVRWVENRNNVRAIRVRELLDAPDDQIAGIDVDAVTEAIRYPLRRPHVALVLWTGTSEAPGGELLVLERFLRELADSLGLRDGPLFVAADRVSGWGWLPLTSGSDPTDRIRSILAAHPDPPFVAIGAPQAGVAGFRRSHRQAHDAHRVALASRPTRPVTAASDPGVVTAALLSGDLARTREWVGDVLGPLASDTGNDARLRETLRVFLREGSSYTAAAQLLDLHHNSVRYRVQRAFERRGRPMSGDRMDIELALMACHLFGSTLLVPPAAGA